MSLSGEHDILQMDFIIFSTFQFMDLEETITLLQTCKTIHGYKGEVERKFIWRVKSYIKQIHTFYKLPHVMRLSTSGTKIIKALPFLPQLISKFGIYRKYIMNACDACAGGADDSDDSDDSSDVCDICDVLVNSLQQHHNGHKIFDNMGIDESCASSIAMHLYH